MPNWIQNKIIIDMAVPEDAFCELLRAVETQQPDNQGNLPVPAEKTARYRCFDFESLIPMPKSLDVEAGTRSDEAQAMAHIFDRWVPALVDYIAKCSSYREIFRGASAEDVKREYKAISLLIHPDVSEDKERTTAAMAKMNSCYQEALKAVPFCGDSAFFDVIYSVQERISYTVNRLRDEMSRAGISPQSYDAIKKFAETKEGTKLLSFGRQLQANIKLYGAPTWYEWACENWGTKWNACDPEVDVDERTITFETAWAPPLGIVSALADRFPKIDWKWFYIDGNWQDSVGRFTHEDGLLSAYEAEYASSEACKIFIEMGGESDCMYQDENGDWHIYACDESCPSHAKCFGTKEANNE